MKRTTLYKFLLVSILLSACGSTENLPGIYKAKENNELVLILRKDSSFTFYNIMSPIFKHPFENDSSFFWVSEGHWTVDNKKILLTSVSNQTHNDLLEVVSSVSLNYNGYELVFLDYKLDTIPSIAVYSYDSVFFAGRYTNKFKLNYTEFSEIVNDESLLSPRDTVEVAFLGYPRVHLPHTDIINHTTTFQLDPLRNSDAFNNHVLKIRRNVLIDKSFNFKFIKINTSGNK